MRVHLPHDAARIDLENRIDKTATLTKESAFFAFPFALDDPIVRTEATGGVLGTDRETVPGSATHMRAIRRWISLSDAAHHAALATADAPLVQLGGITIPYAPYPQSLPQEEPGTVFSWVHNHIWDTTSPPSKRSTTPSATAWPSPKPTRTPPKGSASTWPRVPRPSPVTRWCRSAPAPVPTPKPKPKPRRNVRRRHGS
ncbi:hypothetical protein ACIOKD_36585 [Streptomyces sp. NPDC087844]|uniref:hypothetical protein n=1 Tax=Streptomyces sp. NPDC087844 TaxID=3365805 RepID=UPI00382BC9DC